MRRLLLLLSCAIILNSRAVFCAHKVEIDAEFIKRHEAPAEVTKALKKHTNFFLEVNKAFKNRKVRRRFESTAWQFDELPGYFVKRGSGRIWGREVIMRCIQEHNLDCFTVPRKYFYHIPDMGLRLNDNNYWVVAELVQSTDDFQPFNLEEARQLCILLKCAGFMDFLSHNIIRQKDGKIAIIDTESMWIDPRLPCNGIRELFGRRSFKFNKWFTKEAFKHCITELSTCAPLTRKTYFRILKRLQGQEKPLKWDYVTYFKSLYPQFADS